jgi:hypothetical protein
MSDSMRVLTRLYAWLLGLYPPAFRARFEDEMQTVWALLLDQAAKQGALALAGLCLRELLGAPLGLWRAYRSSWHKRARVPRPLPASVLALPPPPPDGRGSWMQAGLEIGLFVLTGAILVVLTYCPLGRTAPGPGEDGAIGWVVSLGLLAVGLARGLPRWAYPCGGMALGYGLLAAIRLRQLPLLVASLLAFAALAAAAAAVHRWVRPLPPALRRWGQSVRADRTRLSFGIYGAMPLAIASAFDNAYLNDRTPYLALAAACMVAGALAYARGRRTAAQMIALLGGTSLCFACALLDHLHFAGGMGAWTVEGGWLIRLWAGASALTCTPLTCGLARRALWGREA